MSVRIDEIKAVSDGLAELHHGSDPRMTNLEKYGDLAKAAILALDDHRRREPRGMEISLERLRLAAETVDSLIDNMLPPDVRDALTETLEHLRCEALDIEASGAAFLVQLSQIRVLPSRTVIRDADGDVFELDGDSGWLTPGSESVLPHAGIAFPARVLFTPRTEGLA